MREVSRHYLEPDGSQKSFYRKAIVKEYDTGLQVLQSYDTDVLYRIPETGELYRCPGWYQVIERCWTIYEEWTEYSVTTGKHIRAFSGLNKKEYLNLPIWED